LQRIVVAGDSDFLSNIEAARSSMPSSNMSIAHDMFRWMTVDRYPIRADRSPPADTVVDIDNDGIDWMKLALFWITPGLTLSVAGLLLRRRRQH
ncbi:MAG: hypothetical protein ACTHJU_03930, partial [Sphingopyxis sp.]